jgi:hypothetical protein
MTGIKWRDQIRTVIANKLLQIVITILPTTAHGHDLLEAIEEYAERDLAFTLAAVKSDPLRAAMEDQVLKHEIRRTRRNRR